MDSFTPAFFLQLLLVIGTAGAVYGAIKADLRNMHARLTEERRLRETHEAWDDERFQKLGDKLGEVSNKVARVEGASDATSRLTESLSEALRRK